MRANQHPAGIIVVNDGGASPNLDGGVKVVQHETYAFIVIKTIEFEESGFGLEFHDFDTKFSGSGNRAIGRT